MSEIIKRYKPDLQRLNRRNMWFRNEKRKVLIDKFFKKREKIKKKGDWDGLDKLPKNSCPTRVRNLCQLTGRSRGYLRKFKLCRYKFRELASNGELAGIKKTSW